VLIVEDDSETRLALRRALAARGYTIDVAPDGRSALRRWDARRPDVILLDLGLPDIDGLELIRRVRREAATPIVILSGRDDERQKVEALDRGADDYVTKPFGIDELVARLNAALRRSAGPAADPQGQVVIGSLRFDPTTRTVDVAGAPVDLTHREFELLRVLLANAGRLVTKAALLRAVWGTAYTREDAYVYVHVGQLRRKLSAADPGGSLASLIVTEPGIGYRVRSLEPHQP